MMDCRIIAKQYFDHIKAGNGIPLYVQLQEGFRILLGELPDNSLLPSERELADELKINRRTLRKALEPFITERRLLRSQRGTVVHHQPRATAPQQEAHPFTLDVASPPVFWGKSVLRIMLYESLPFQKKFWEETIELFNRQNSDIKLESFSAPAISRDMTESYWLEFEKENFDLVHLPVSYRWKANISNFLAEIPRDLQDYTASPEFASGVFGQTAPDLLRYSVPFAFAPRVYCWNRRLVETLGLDVHHMSLEDILEKAGKLPDETATMSDFYDLCLDLAVPERFTVREIKEQLKIILKRLHLASARNRYRNNPRELERHLQAGQDNVLLRCFYTLMLNVHGKNLADYLFTPIPVRQGGLLWGGCSALGISREGSLHPGVLQFLKFMLSDEIQRKIATDQLMVPVRRSEWSVLAEVLQMDLRKFAASLERCRENPAIHPPPVGLALLRFQDIMAGKTPDAEAAKLVLNYYGEILQTSGGI
jgi:DNA-binding transcriptional regulator YhcF (GntR family)/ABC-type glycerol-3-phosphate transport system substrate-binding protein